MMNKLSAGAVVSVILLTLNLVGISAQELPPRPAPSGQTIKVAVPASDPGMVLHEGTPIRMRLARNLSSADAHIGESVDFEVLDEVKVGNFVVVARGATAMGTVTDAKSKRSMGRAGRLDVNIDYVRLASGEKIPLRGIQDAKAGGHVGAMTGAMVATSIVFFPAAPLFLFIHGKDITIPKGHEITCYTNSEVKLDATQFSPVQTAAVIPANVSAAAPQLSGKALKNSDVIELKNAGFADDFLISKIKSSPSDFSLDTKDLIALRGAGLSDSVIAAMMTAVRKP